MSDLNEIENQIDSEIELLEMIRTEQLVRFNHCTEVTDYGKEDLKDILQALYAENLGYEDEVETLSIANLPLASDLSYIVYGVTH